MQREYADTYSIFSVHFFYFSVVTYSTNWQTSVSSLKPPVDESQGDSWVFHIRLQVWMSH